MNTNPLEQYYEKQFEWLSKIIKNFETLKQSLPYYVEEIKADVSLPQLGATLTIRLHRTLNNGQTANLQSLSEDGLFKRASFLLNMGPEKIYYNRIRFWGGKWSIALRDKKKLTSIHTDEQTTISDKSLEEVISLLDKALDNKMKINKHIPGYIYFQ